MKELAEVPDGDQDNGIQHEFVLENDVFSDYQMLSICKVVEQLF